MVRQWPPGCFGTSFGIGKSRMDIKPLSAAHPWVKKPYSPAWMQGFHGLNVCTSLTPTDEHRKSLLPLLQPPVDVQTGEPAGVEHYLR